LADVKTKMGDFVIGDLSKAINTDKRNELIVSNIVELVKSGRQGICFAADVEHSKSLCSALKKEIRAVEVYGDTPAETRRNIMESIRSHNVDCIVNNMIFTEGTDIPHLSFVCMARPTRFLGLYIQAVGRGLRKCPEINKKDCIVIDVNDKIKVKQTRVTFVDMAVAGDLYGEKKRATNVLQAPVPVEPISNKLKNFPIIISKTYADRWTVDEDAFSISSWLISQDQWIVTWSSETKEPKLISRSIYAPWTELPPYDYNIAGRSVKHATFGQGTVVRIVDRDNPKVVVDFGWSNQKTVEMESLNVQKFIKEFSPSETETIKIDKLFYICVPDLNELGRVIHFVRQGKDLILRDDQRLDKFQIDAYLQGEALKDNVLQLVRTNAKWKMGPASDKQKKYVSGVMDRIGFDLDLDDLTKGEASAVIEQVKWQEIIYAKFGTDHKNKLMGYDTTTNDL
ncbi:MAG TPA: helicase-related protein, partial [Paenisporosarcina sp.]|nr:helicase-related protein [Paenisporosarcina sp.]